MAISKPRSRIISVRLSEDEYAALRRLCMASGARSVSDLTRKAMRVLLDRVPMDGNGQEGNGQEGSMGGHLDEFRTQMRNLDRKVDTLRAEIDSFKANGAAIE